MIYIHTSARKLMAQDALCSFPNECCGFFYGTEDEEGTRTVKEVLVVNNAKEGDQRRRFEISPKDYLKAEQYADERNLRLLGVYHSHPNHPAVPSEHDRVAAQPYFSYIIISVYNKQDINIRSWRLNDHFQFQEETVAVREYHSSTI
jgi:proteasome lid subunit RPN8/RPN11